MEIMAAICLGKCGSSGKFIQRKAPEDWRTPRRFAFYESRHVARSVLECGGPPPFFPAGRNARAGLTRVLESFDFASIRTSEERINKAAQMIKSKHNNRGRNRVRNCE